MHGLRLVRTPPAKSAGIATSGFERLTEGASTLKPVTMPVAVLNRLGLLYHRKTHGINGCPVHLCNEGPAEGRSAAAHHSRRHLAELLSRRQDRRPRRQRRGQVLASPHHGRGRRGFSGRSV